MGIRPRLALAILGFTVPFVLNCCLIAVTGVMMVRDEKPLLIVICITLSLCITLIAIKALLFLITELAGPLETGPARRRTAKDARDLEEVIPMTSHPMRRSSSVPLRPDGPVPPPSTPPPSPVPTVRMVRSATQLDH